MAIYERLTLMSCQEELVMESLARRSQDFRAVRDQFNRMFEPFFPRFVMNDELENQTWVPPVDVSETNEKIVLTAELPGFRQEDIELKYEDGMLTIRGERAMEKETSDRTWHRIERRFGTFLRSFNLPRTVNAEEISAAYHDGVLEVSIPKRDEAKPKQIRIGIN